jgi:hypothetical protein
MNQNEIDLSWAAGLFEGEGTFTLAQTGRTNYPKAALVMADEDIVRRFHEIVAVGRVCNEQRKQRAEHHKMLYRWTVSQREGFLTFAALLMPYLGSRRRIQLISVLDGMTEGRQIKTRALENQKLTLLSQLAITS